MQDVSNVRTSVLTGGERHKGINERLAHLEVRFIFREGGNPMPRGGVLLVLRIQYRRRVRIKVSTTQDTE